MPIIETGGSLSVVAHEDDDILFMNPDIADGIAAGEPTTTIFVSAGDAGLDEAYWSGREEGAKAAYALMAGSGTWIDETLTLTVNGQSFDIATSWLEDDPQVRLYFLRLPDGGGLLDPGEEQQLARLQAGTLESLTSVDGANTYSHDDLTGVLTALMDLHAPSEFRLQVADGDYAAGEHTDHISTTLFAEEALAAHAGENYTVTHYVQYQSDDLAANLSPEDAQLALDIMLAYAEHDPAVLDENGNLAQVYVDWTGREYVASEYTVENGVIVSGTPDPTDPAPGGTTYSLSGPDAQLFVIDSATGALTTQDWFTPSLDDAWDANGDYTYELTRTATPSDGSAPTSETLWYDTTAEGVLTLTTDDPAAPDPLDPTGPTDPVDPVDPTDPGTGTDPGGTTYSLSGPDAQLFVIDSATGTITPQDWFTPSLDDAWDANGDYTYELTRTATPSDGSSPTSETLWYDTTAEGVLTLTTEDPATPDPLDPGTGTGSDPATGSGTAYTLSGPDAQLFVINSATGAITTQDWFIPSHDDAWDVDEDHIYELTRTATPGDGSPATSEDLAYQVLPDDSMIELLSGAELMASFTETDPATDLLPPPDDPVEEDPLLDAVL